MIASKLFRIPLVGVLAILAGAAGAQDFPVNGSITLVSGFAAGGGADTAARIIAKKLTATLGRTVVVQNNAGAGGSIAHQMVANATPDGSTILMGSIGPLAITPHLMKVQYDPERSFAPLTMGVDFPNVLVVNPNLGVKTLAEYVALAKSKPGELTFASSGVGSSSHLTGEMFNQRAGVEILHVPYKGGSPAMVDLLAGRVTACFFTPSTAAPYIESGKLIALATTGLERLPTLPSVPTVAESGYPEFSATNWYAFLAPAATPEAILVRWNQELVKALSAPDVREQLIGHGLIPAPGTREALKTFIARESASWGKVIKERKITAQ